MPQLVAVEIHGPGSIANAADTPVELWEATTLKAQVANVTFCNVIAQEVNFKLFIDRAGSPRYLLPGRSLRINEVGTMDGAFAMEVGDKLMYECDQLNGVHISATILDMQVI